MNTNLLHFVILLTTIFYLSNCNEITKETPIDRFALINRHNISIEEVDTLNSLSIGNGNFAFTTDITGLQTFYKEYENGVPLGTQSNWGWHTIPDTQNYSITESEMYYTVEGREVPYLHQIKDDERKAGASVYFRENPHRIHLGMIRLIMKKKDGSDVVIKDIQQPKHQLDLWKGKITAGFLIEEIPVQVEVFCHQELDMISVKIKSPLINENRLAVEWDFSYGVTKNTHPGYNFSVPEKHQSIITDSVDNKYIIKRILDNDQYFVNIDCSQPSEFQKTGSHAFRLNSKNNSASLEFSCLFSPEETTETLPVFEQTAKNSTKTWENFWKTGGAVDFSACTDPRARELERRTVLSQYLTKIQSSGDFPPAETGLTYNSWYGKFHLEMHWWHSAHFQLWNRPEYIEKQMQYYFKIFDKAKKTAEKQGYKGVRWPKMTDREGNDSPSSVGVYLIWQQPHVIYYAEQLYRSNPTKKTLKKYIDLVTATADFMADFPQYDSTKQIYNLNPPLIPAQEHWSRETTVNPPFELAYWHWGLSTAQKWNERLGLPENTEWKDVCQKIAAPVAVGELYMGTANSPDSYTNPDNTRDHPIVLGCYGVLPYWNKMDTTIMQNTLSVILEKWNWPSTWGWDYPLTAMNATRLGRPEDAINALLKNVQKNTYLINGHNYQSERLRIYLPGNGGFLTTIAMMCAGWDGCTTSNPGFPKNDKWNVKWENLSPML